MAPQLPPIVNVPASLYALAACLLLTLGHGLVDRWLSGLLPLHGDPAHEHARQLVAYVAGRGWAWWRGG